ncbi:efflux pump [Lojkania enalia]|uniref:Efflux pump n=1 Tax=Lojkania enalia TaxID=147567 RepID=A0A9P4TQW0_9PLEO|nr:efflux pump [Didymosphaeria enalia]
MASTEKTTSITVDGEPDTRPRSAEPTSEKLPPEETLMLDSDDKEADNADIKSDNAAGYVTGFKLALVVGSVALACFLMLLDTMVISTAVPRITDAFNSLPDVGWYASAYQFGSAAPQPLTGKVYTHFNSKWSFLFFFGIFEFGSVLCGAAVSSNMLIVGRAVAGFGAAGIINGAITIISSCAPLEKRPTLIGLTMGLNQLGLVAGPLIGGAFTSYTTWRWCFYINLPLGAFTALVLLLLRIPEQTPKKNALVVLAKLHHYLDLVGFVLFAPAVLQLLLALQYGGNQYPWNSSRVIGLFCGSGANFIVWLFWNWHKGDDALLPSSMLKQRVVWTSGLYQSFMISAVYGATFFLPIYFQAINNATPVLSGVYLLPTILPQLFAAGLSGILLQKMGFVIPIAIVGTILLTVGSGLYSLLQPASPTGYWVGFQIIAGIGSGLSMQLAIISVQAAVSGEQLATGMALIIFAQSLGPAIVLVLCNVIFLSSLSSQLREKAPSTNAAAVIQAGATGFRAVVQPNDLPGVLSAYANSVDRVFYLVAAVAGACAIVLWGMGWHDLRKKDASEENSTDNAEKQGEKTVV